jgi:general secretion pathway protein L
MILVRLAPEPRWQRFADGREIAAGAGWPAAGEPVVVAVPGEAVALHWLDLPDLAPAQAAAAARLMLGEQLGENDPHIAVAAGTGARAVAVVARTAMAGWLAQLAGAGLTASALVPDMLLLPAPAAGYAVLHQGGRTLARSSTAAFAAEADLAALLIGAAPTSPARLTLPDPLPMNLLSGAFAPVSRWQPPTGLARRLGVLAATLAGLWLAGDGMALLRARSAAADADAATLALARPLLPAGANDGAAALAQLKSLAQARGADGGMSALAAPLTAAIAQRNSAALASLSYTHGGGIVAGVAGGEGEARALAAALDSAGLRASAGLTRATSDGSITDVTVQRR